ncbi:MULTISPECIES: PA2169 family four-helix-bundle protein [unclassified Variovorax]|uniref:PA2169 family four-helix-bundle protein n=1 Tax=unclassified Variovorax TaxID=663243 RepID=UPI001BD54E46|nr:MULTISPECIES: PA2169 family four-helix-bundle protein [unclassified Variovorax]
MAKDQDFPETRDQNRDPITGAPGAHPVGTGVGATGGALAGAAAGAMAGPVGAAVGLVAGAVVGGLGGKAVGERINPTAEDAYWRKNYDTQPYYEAGYGYDDYGPAYQLGYTGRDTLGRDFDTVEPTLASRWEADRGASQLDWPRARQATRAAWDRADQTYFNADEVTAGDGPAYEEPLSNDDVVDVLNDLLENTRDGGYGFLTCAEEVESASMKQLFLSRAEGCRQAESELVQLITTYGGKPSDGGTAAGAMHRGWVHVKGALGANSELSILESCERGEDTAIARYRKALKQSLPADVRSVVQRQADGAQRNHDQIRDLRNAARARDEA